MELSLDDDGEAFDGLITPTARQRFQVEIVFLSSIEGSVHARFSARTTVAPKVDGGAGSGREGHGGATHGAVCARLYFCEVRFFQKNSTLPHLSQQRRNAKERPTKHEASVQGDAMYKSSLLR